MYDKVWKDCHKRGGYNQESETSLLGEGRRLKRGSKKPIALTR
jgi:hypothetical protein